MKKILIFFGGFVVGILTTIFVAYLFSIADKPNDGLLGLTIFSEKGECITKNDIEIFQVIEPNMALAETGVFPDRIVVLLINYDGKSYYDAQRIKIPNQKCARQVGTYQYTTKRDKIEKTVPAVVIE